MPVASDIDAARALLERAERETDPDLKAHELEQGLALLRDCEEDEITPQERTLIGNVRAAHTRRLLTQLVQLRAPSMDVWLQYVGLLFGMLRPEVERALATEPALKENFDRFAGLYGGQLRDLLHTDILAERRDAKP
jgi:hypothetical protein